MLSAVQEDTTQRMIIDKRPEQLKMDFSLWSRAAVGQLIEQEFGIKLQVRSIGKYLTRWGFTPQKPIRKNPSSGPTSKAQRRCRLGCGGTRQKLSMIATVTNQGKTRWMIIDEAFDAEKFIEFLEALIKDADRKVFLILDKLRVHHSKLVKAWVAERPNADLKQEMGKRVPVRTKANLREAANEHMAMLERNPERVMSYFQDRRVRYAA